MPGRFARVAFFAFVLWSNWLAVATCERHNGDQAGPIGLAGGAIITGPADFLVTCFDTMTDNWLGFPAVSSPIYCFPWFAAQLLALGAWTASTTCRRSWRALIVLFALTCSFSCAWLLFTANVTDERTLAIAFGVYWLLAALACLTRWLYFRRVRRNDTFSTGEMRFSLRTLLVCVTATCAIAGATKPLLGLGDDWILPAMIVVLLLESLAVVWTQVSHRHVRRSLFAAAVGTLLAVWFTINVGAADESDSFLHEGRVNMIFFTGECWLFLQMSLIACGVCRAVGLLELPPNSPAQPLAGTEAHSPLPKTGFVTTTPAAGIAASCHA